MESTSDTINRLLQDLQGDDQFAHSQAAFALGMLGDPRCRAIDRSFYATKMQKYVCEQPGPSVLWGPPGFVCTAATC